ncbi:MAG: hypothetical protein ACFE0O_08375 [Opitutales bacterium]
MTGRASGPSFHFEVLADTIRRRCLNGDGLAALEEVEALLEQVPDSVDLHVIHAGVLKHLGHFGSAAGAFAEAARRAPDDAATWFGLGICLEAAGHKAGATQAFARAMVAEPKHPDAFFKTMEALRKGRFFARLLERLDKAVSPVRDRPEWFRLRAATAFELGDFRYGRQPPPRFRRMPEQDRTTCLLNLRAITYDPKLSGADLLKAAQAFDRTFGPETVDELPLTDPDPERPLRIGMVDTRMRQHNIGLQHLMLMRNRPPKAEMEIFLYPSNDQNDETTEEMMTLADGGTDIRDMDDATACRAIRADHLDLLVDFNEYANGGRMGLFARRAAPVQVHYLANALSTGLRAMDYRISDPVAEPAASFPAASAEEPMLLENGYHFLVPRSEEPDIVYRTPARDAGYVTFGMIHHPAKYGPDVLAAWKVILERLPTARLLIGRHAFDDPETAAWFHRKLVKAGLPADRVTVRGDHGEIVDLRFWKQVDCVLDSFAFSGDASAMDSLFAGVPLVTRLGSRISSRRGAALLHHIGHPELVTETVEAYIDLAVSLGSDADRLDHYRSRLHAAVKASPLLDYAGTAAAIYAGFRESWRRACARA